MIRFEMETRWDGDEFLSRAERRAHELARKLADRAAEFARGRAPVASGKLRESIEVRPAGDGFDVVADAPHAAAIEKGSARNGTLPRPFLVPALGDAFGELPAVARSLGLEAATAGNGPGIDRYDRPRAFPRGTSENGPGIDLYPSAKGVRRGR